MEKQLTFYFGDYDEERIIDTVKNEFTDLRDIKLTYSIWLGDEVNPLRAVHVSREVNTGFFGDSVLLSLVGKIELTEKMMGFFNKNEGEIALAEIQKKAKKLANKVRASIWQ